MVEDVVACKPKDMEQAGRTLVELAAELGMRKARAYNSYCVDAEDLGRSREMPCRRDQVVPFSWLPESMPGSVMRSRSSKAVSEGGQTAFRV